MIISRTPLRLSFSGGGSDLPSFYKEEEGAVLSAALGMYIDVLIRRGFDSSIKLSYYKNEIQSSPELIEHPIFRSVLCEHLPQGGVEIASMSDVPSGTGLGSSSTFTVGLLNAVHRFLGRSPGPEQLAREACDVEIDKVGEPIGKQDQYVASYGGLNYIRFLPSGEVFVEPVQCQERTLRGLQESCMLFYTGKTRQASTVFREHSENMSAKRDGFREMAQLAGELKDILESNPRTLEGFGQLLHAAWEIKKSMSNQISTTQIDGWYDAALEAGAWGGRILGAGGGGFLLIAADPSKKTRIQQALADLRSFDVSFEKNGSKIIFAE